MIFQRIEAERMVVFLDACYELGHGLFTSELEGVLPLVKVGGR